MDKPIIGINEKITLVGLRRTNVPAKIDTGADGSAIWVSDLKVTKDNVLKFKLFGPKSPFYTGKVIRRTNFSVAIIRGGNGIQQIRYRTHFSIRIGEKRLKLLFSLSDRSEHKFPVIIGRRAISGKFLVDVSKRAIPLQMPKQSPRLNQENTKSPYHFYKKYVKK
ncbi:MAG: RimK/LysX family protein [Candidatus Saccharimonadales bacterium]